MIQELDRVILTSNIPEYSLEEGDIGTVVLVHQGGKGYEVEFSHWMARLWQLFHFTAYKCVPLVEEKLRDRA